MPEVGGRPAPMNREQRVVLAVAILASFVSFLDGTVVNVALPAIQRDLGGGLVTQQWVVDAYLLTLGTFILVAGSLSDVFGRVVVMRAGLIGFGLASIAVGAAPTPVLLIAARAAQGVAGALLVPSSLALITSGFRDAAQARAIGVWTGVTTAATLFGPVLGGVLIDAVSWRAVFFINVLPIGITLWLLARLRRPEARTRGATIDWTGALLCAIGLGGVVFALIEQRNLGWASPAIWAPAGVGALAIAGFLVRQRFAQQPMMPLGMFRVRNFWSGNLATAFVYGALSLYGLVLTVYLQQGAGLSATLAGLASLPPTVIMAVFSSRVGTWAGRLGPRLFMTVGPAVMAAGMLLLLTVRPHFDYWSQVLPSLVLFGVGLTLTVAPLTSAILGSIETSRSGIASAVNNAVARVAGLVAVASLGTIVGEALDLAGLWRAALLMAALMVAGATVSFSWIRRPA